MKQLGRVIITLGAMAALSACAGVQLERAEQTEPSGTEFRKALYAEYIVISRAEYAEGDYADSDIFARRAMLAAGGSLIEPERIEDRQLPQGKVDELTNAREWLLTTYSNTATDKAPDDAARAQAQFDCWIAEQEENFQPDDIAACRSGFLAAMGKLEEATREPLPSAAGRVAAATAAASAAAAPLARQQTDDIYVLFFDFDSAGLNDAAKAVIAKALADFKIAQPDVVRIEGHTDTAGPAAYNVKLSDRRVATVAKALEAGGVSSRIIERKGVGEKQPLIFSGENKREEKNRRVEVIFY